ncbi:MULTISPECIES: alanine racemase [unclassified Paenibacillus]|uniref:alanine racemase n=1 Tax=unclassified Paenibacillus TaxID=185978 RepID=UPI00240491EA|nr:MULTISPECIES: alanine racemase [unclassified Paenibacillus]MDF9842082.1 alanine racemase [Paenibacillus sp. PastF-2]MDF9848664.1 alanine racemase [Paenibacillus sp. PastM-2]MDF9855233.1 alanine racemase [Paenibacillus sp. PastF-1]MDH6480504.1 alanine racemase [Paenibacillus sp. PastH-2]MDH6507931.1 alanine racemase [Paenibacillus sp. PastM-3]
MQASYRPTVAEINLDDLRANYDAFRATLPAETKFMGCVKGNAYGHGAVEVSRELERLGADYVSVAFLDEALELRQAGILLPILVLGYTSPEGIAVAWENKVTVTLFTPEVLEAIRQLPEDPEHRLKVHIKIDSGMGRLGLLPADAPAFIEEVHRTAQAELEGMFTHFAKADEEDKSYTLLQYRRFMSVAETLRDKEIQIPIIHTGNSATAIDTPFLSSNMVRVGISLYGFYPSTEVNHERVALHPVMTLKTQAVYIKTLPPGYGISYGTRYFTDSEEVIATLPVGYADGYSRMLTGKAEVLIRGRRAPVVGTICMDQCMVTLKSFAGEAEQIQAGEEVVLIGRQGNASITADELALHLGTINYEVICMLAHRVPRVYIREGAAPNLVNPLLKS